MTYLNYLGRRSFLKIAAAVGGASTLGALPNLAGTQNTDTPQQTASTLTGVRRGQCLLA
jgi:anaerobic selenocysteine-containing dehydrogenase